MATTHATSTGELKEQRIDTWLWASRFFKSRKIAHHAVSSGHIWINGNKCKPAKLVRIGDQLKIRRNYELYLVEVQKLSAKRLSAPAAQTLFSESDESKQARLKARELQKINALSAPRSAHRPSKRDRRELLKLKNQP